MQRLLRVSPSLSLTHSLTVSVFLCMQLKTSEPTVKGLYGVYSYKWVLAGVGLLLQIE